MLANRPPELLFEAIEKACLGLGPAGPELLFKPVSDRLLFGGPQKLPPIADLIGQRMGAEEPIRVSQNMRPGT